VTARIGIDPHVRFNSVGFRVARTLRQPILHRSVCALISVNSGLAATRMPDGTLVQQKFRESPTQAWRVEQHQEGGFVLRAPDTDEVLAIPSQERGNSIPGVVEPFVDDVFHRWLALPDGDGYLFMNVGSQKVLDVDGISRNEGTRIIQFAQHGNANQKWWVRPMNAALDSD
jgi:hypothetical protein